MKKSPLQYALDMVALRDRTEFEINKKMSEKGFAPEEIIKTIKWLKDKKFIDDEKFADNYVKSQCRIGRNGLFKIKYKLQTLGINKELINKYANCVDIENEQSRATELASKWMIKYGHKEKKYDKLGRFLIGRGFSIDIVKNVLDKTLK